MPAMLKISKKTLFRAGVAAFASMIVSLAAALILVPILGGQTDGPGFWMSAFLPLAIAFPASTWQFHQNEVLASTRDQLADLHEELDRTHRDLMNTHAILLEQARRDAMTGALNRETFFSLLEAASRDDRPSAVLIADADHFKLINDTHGHHYGDEALKAIAAAINSILRPEDFWGRIGGEEFAIYLDRVDTAQAAAIAERLRAKVEAIELKAGGAPVPVTISIGGLCVHTFFDATLAVNEADRCMYAAKHNGRNRVMLSGNDIVKRDSEAA
jgi:diguanylate cyclase (GGDEF)-like protein